MVQTRSNRSPDDQSSDGSPQKPTWPRAAATGQGPMPGGDIDESLRVSVGELPELPFLPQLPSRGVGADPAGRTIAMLVDIWADVVPSGWRVSRRPTRDVHRARDFLARDLDALELHARDAALVKVQLCGPWTLGALLEVPAGHRVITDEGAVRDLTASLAEGLAAHLVDLRKRLPRAGIVIQLDEFMLPAVLAGTLPTASGLTMVRPIDPAVARDHLREILAAVPDVLTVANGGRRHAPLSLFGQAGFDAVRVDFSSLGRAAADLDPVGESLSAGTVVLGGVIPTSPPAGDTAPGTLAEWARPITEPLRALGFSAQTLADLVIPTPAGPLDDATPEWATEALQLSRSVSRLLAEGSADSDGDAERGQRLDRRRGSDR